MVRHSHRLFIPIAILCAACISSTAYAEQPGVSAHNTGLLTIQLPEVDHQVLVEKLGALRSRLIQRKQALLQIVEDSDLDGRDAVITAIMPGGLLYAGYKKARHEQAQNELARINADIAEYSSDILAMQATPSPVAMAQLP